MRIAAVTRYKQGELFIALQRAHWSQNELARRTGLKATKISEYCLMKRRPSEEHASLIQRAFGEISVYIDVLEAWPEGFKVKGGLIKTQVQDVDDSALLEFGRRLELEDVPTPDELIAQAERLTLADKAYEELSERDRGIVQAVVVEKKSLESVGAKVGLTRERVRQIKNVALAKMRGAVLREEIRVNPLA